MEDEEIIGFDALWNSMQKCRRGVIWKDSAASFVLNAVPEITRLSNELGDGSYRERPHKYFTVKYPKERTIMSISFRDRVYQRSLNDVAIYPAMSRSFIYDNAACQRGKGADFARKRMKCHMQRFYRKHGTDGYILKIDIRKYYDSMQHDVVKRIFREKLPENVSRRADAILDGFPGETGFNPGSQIIQIAGISVPDRIDHYIKERLRVKHYLRYMDDMVLIADSRADLVRWLGVIREQLAGIGFDVHPDKTRITTVRQGVMWLGYHYRLTDTGKVVMTADPGRLRSTRKKYYRLVQKCRRGEISRKKVDESYRCWRECASKGDGYRMLQNMDRYYLSLWRDEDAQDRIPEVSAGGRGPGEPDGLGAAGGTGKHDSEDQRAEGREIYPAQCAVPGDGCDAKGIRGRAGEKLQGD